MRKMHVLALTVLFILFFSTDSQASECMEERLETMTREAASQGYDKNFIELVEMIYGEGFLSQGGAQSVKNMIGDLDLNDSWVLDIGSGLGGPSIYLAKHFNAHIVGLDPQDWMIERANSNLDIEKEQLKGFVDFIFMKSSSHLQQFSDASFDVVFSKEALLHIPREVKPQFFSEIYRVLKPGGSIIIMDWMCTATHYSENTKKMMELDAVAYNLITYEDYHQILQDAGFTEIIWENTTMESCRLSQQNVNTILLLESKIKTKYDADIFHESLSSWQWQRDAFRSEELMTGVFRAKKI